MGNAFNNSSLLLTPNAVKAGKIYSVVPSDGSGDILMSRATTATRVNSLGVIENVGLNIARLNYDTVGGCPSILLEPQRTNRLLNSATVATQTIATTGLVCTVSFYGTGTITFTGTYVGSLVGTGVNNRVSLTFTPTTGSLVLTVVGSCTNGQLETGAYVTSYIPTVGSITTRNNDVISLNNIYTNGLITSAGGTWFVELNNNISLVRDFAGAGIYLMDSAATNYGFRLKMYGGTVRLSIAKTINSIETSLYTTTTDIIKTAIKWNGFTADIFVNGIKVVSATPFTDTQMSVISSIVSVPLYMKSMILFPIPLTDQECASLTTI